ncbi:MAG: hypothetical protein M1823_002617 [Watsoniomyces obsoletus]|nr:MAG: hypothetical protein M1823_002617 [Watsoniomyces obsoletus]
MSKNIVIVGGSWVGIALAHKLLKHVLPTMPGSFKVIMISSSTHFYMNLAAPRAVVPGLLKDEQLFAAIEPAFSKYPADSFEFIEGTAESLDDAQHQMTVSTPSGTRTVQYDIGIIATGSSAGDSPFKLNRSYEHTRDELHAMRKAVEDASDIVVGGAGPTGIETVAELGDEYQGKDKKITLISSGEHVLPELRPNIGIAAEKELEKFGVKILRNTRVENMTPTEKGRTEVKLSTGTTLMTDLYISTVGVHPNSAWLPARFLDAEGHVMVDDCLQVKGASDLYAAGDVANVHRKQLKIAEDQSIYLANSLHAVLTNKPVKPFKPDGMTMVAITLGKNKGTGQAGWFKMLSFIVWYVKGRFLGTNDLGPYVNGEKFVINGKM